MAVHSDFNVVPIREHLGDNVNDINTDFPFVGGQSSVRQFRIEGNPVDDAYLLINHTHVHSDGHVIRINGTDLPWLDILANNEGRYTTHMKLIPPGLLFNGMNSVQVVRNGGDNFIVFEIIVHWREET